MKIDGILFDLDGTLWDSSRNVTCAWNEVFRRHGLEKELTAQELLGYMGMLMHDIFRGLLPGLDPERLAQVEEECCRYENDYIREHGGLLFSGLEETLEELAGEYPMMIISNCQAGYIEAFLEASHLGRYFCDLENPGRTGLPKADNIRLVVQRHRLAHPVYVGDTQGDRDSAAKAGVPFIYARYGFGEVSDYEGVIDSIRELPAMLRQMEGRWTGAFGDTSGLQRGIDDREGRPDPGRAAVGGGHRL